MTCKCKKKKNKNKNKKEEKNLGGWCKRSFTLFESRSIAVKLGTFL